MGCLLTKLNSVFDDPEFITVVDDEHSHDEERYITVGLSEKGRLLMLAHTDRGGRILGRPNSPKTVARFLASACRSRPMRVP